MTVQLPTGYAAISLEFRHVLDPDSWWTTFGVDSSNHEGDMGVLASFIEESFWTAWSDQISNEVTFVGVQVRLGDDSSEPPIHYHPVGSVGGNADEKLPQNCALLVKKQSALGGKKHRGRMFLPGILSEGQVDQVGIISPANLTSLQQDAVNFHTALAVGGPPPAAPMVILHQDEGLDTPLPTVVTDLTVDQRISTQRRRLR